MSRARILSKILLTALTPFSARVEVAGSVRRGDNNPRDIDILIIPRDKSGIMQRIRLFKGAVITKQGAERVDAVIDGISVNLMFTTALEWAPALMYFTGPKGANIHNRKLAAMKGYRLNQRGLFDAKTERRLHTPTEASIYKLLEKSYRHPSARGRGR